MKRVATIILNRNLPDPTNALYEHIQKYDGDLTDIFVVEAGSDEEKLSKYCTWHVTEDNVIATGLRYSRGMNYGLCQLWKTGEFSKYDAFLLLTNDTELEKKHSIEILMSIMDTYTQIGILTPCSRRWGERFLIQDHQVKFFWFIHNNAYLLRREFIECICNQENPTYMDFLYDGTNFRGYMQEEEIIAKAYANDFVAAITNQVWMEENESHLLNHADRIKTETYSHNMKLYLEEGLRWIKKKYGYNDRWMMQQYVRLFYESYFDFHPEQVEFKI